MNPLWLQSRVVKVPVLSEGSTVELKESLAAAFDLPLNAPLRMLFKGKNIPIDQDTRCEDVGLHDGVTIMVMHSKSSDVEAVQTAKPERMRGFEEGDRRQATGGLGVVGSGGSSVSAAYSSRAKLSQYRFHSLQPLTELPPGVKPDSAACYARLDELAKDGAVMKILEEHRWSIGKLCEMPPEGLVGVSQSCLMGLNRNKGEEILLRLRTDDWSGLRPYLSVIDVLLHELAHCVHSDHDNEFKALWALLKMEYAQHRSRLQSGRSTAATGVYDPSAQWAASDSERSAHQLGGAAPPHLSATEAAAAAAAARASAVAACRRVAQPNTQLTSANTPADCEECQMEE